MKKTAILLTSVLLIAGIAAATSPPENQQQGFLDWVSSTLSDINPFSTLEQGDITAQTSPDAQTGETEVSPAQPPWYLRTFAIVTRGDTVEAGGELEWIYTTALSDSWCASNDGPLTIPTNLQDESGDIVEQKDFTYYCDGTVTSVRFEDVDAPDTPGTYTWEVHWDFDAMDNSWSGTNQIDSQTFEVSGYEDPVSVRISPPPEDQDENKETVGLDTNPNLEAITEGSPDVIEWDAGDGNTITGEEFDHTYDSTGTYTVEVEAYDEGTDNRDTDTRIIEVESPTIRAQFYLDSDFNRYTLDDTFTVGQTLDLKSSSIGMDLEKQWKGDVQGTGDSITTSFEDGGEKEITLQVTDSQGQTDSTTRIVQVAHDPPEADYNIYTEEDSISLTMPRGTATAEITEEVELDGTQSEEGTTQIVQYDWNIEGETLTGENPEWQPTETGEYDVELTVTDQAGLQDTVTEQDIIQVVNPTLEPEMDVPSTGVTGEPIEMSLDRDNSVINSEVDRVIWDIPEAGTLTEENVRPTFETTGNYYIEMQVIDEYGQAETQSKTITITEPDEEPGLLATLTRIINNLL